jgi:hypothetical protein
MVCLIEAPLSLLAVLLMNFLAPPTLGSFMALETNSGHLV